MSMARKLPIEKLWSILKRQVDKQQPTNSDDARMGCHQSGLDPEVD